MIAKLYSKWRYVIPEMNLLLVGLFGFLAMGANSPYDSNHNHSQGASEHWSGRATYDNSVMKCGDCRMNLLFQRNNTAWVEMHSNVGQSANGVAVITFINPFTSDNFPPPHAIIRNTLFLQQSPCFVTSQTEEGENGDAILKQLRCESEQMFVCGSSNSGADESVPDSLAESCKDNKDTCWNDEIDASSPAVPGCLAKPNPGSLRSTGGSISGGYGGHRIINGVDADIREHPWAVLLTIADYAEKEFICRASIIGTNLVLTARHCMDDFDIDLAPIQILTGTSTRAKTTPLDRSTYDLIFHPNKDVDLLVIKLKNPIKQTSTTSAIALPPNSDTHPVEKDWVMTIGWGMMCNDPPNCKVEEKYATELQSVGIQVANRDKVAGKYKTIEDDPYETLTRGKLNRSFFAGGKQVYPESKSQLKKDACSGDSGGALECKNPKTGQKYICGVTSFGPPPPRCGQDPGGYVMLWTDEVLTFLNEQVKQQSVWKGGLNSTNSNGGIQSSDKDGRGKQPASFAQFKVVHLPIICTLSILPMSICLCINEKLGLK